MSGAAAGARETPHTNRSRHKKSPWDQGGRLLPENDTQKLAERARRPRHSRRPNRLRSLALRAPPGPLRLGARPGGQHPPVEGYTPTCSACQGLPLKPQMHLVGLHPEVQGLVRLHPEFQKAAGCAPSHLLELLGIVLPRLLVQLGLLARCTAGAARGGSLGGVSSGAGPAGAAGPPRAAGTLACCNAQAPQGSCIALCGSHNPLTPAAAAAALPCQPLFSRESRPWAECGSCSLYGSGPRGGGRGANCSASAGRAGGTERGRIRFKCQRCARCSAAPALGLRHKSVWPTPCSGPAVSQSTHTRLKQQLGNSCTLRRRSAHTWHDLVMQLICYAIQLLQTLLSTAATPVGPSPPCCPCRAVPAGEPGARGYGPAARAVWHPCTAPGRAQTVQRAPHRSPPDPCPAPPAATGPRHPHSREGRL